MYYVVAQLTITNPVAYQSYLSAFMSVLDGSGGRVLAADTAPDVIEGQWQGDKVVLLSFPDEARFRQWVESPEYREIAKCRLAGAAGPVIGVHGVGRNGESA